MENRDIAQKITDTLEQNYMPYAMSVIVSRAIPEIDGFKPAHRKLLYTMYKMGLLTGKKTKSANIVGQTMKLNPHGDQAIYETMVRLTKGYEALNTPFIDSKGNFGKQYSRDMSYAAPRYTEAKLADICEEIFQDIDKNTVDFVENYDGTLKEPTLLPTKFPNILVNANQGIAVGMANNICGFNLKEVCEATIQYLKNENADLTKYLKAPDFPAGGQLIYNENQINQIFDKGRGSFKIRAKYRYDKKNNCIEVYQIPYTTTTEVIIDKIIDLMKANKIKEISDIRDETDLGGLKVTLDLKRNTNADDLMNKLYKFTPLEDSFSCNFNILVNGEPKVMGVREILKEWTIFRIQCVKRKLQYDITKKSKRMHLLSGLAKILLDMDKAIRIIRDTEKDKEVITNLMSGFGIDQDQAEYIAEIKLRNLNKEYILKQTAERKNLSEELEQLRATLEDEKRIKKDIMEELRSVAKKYGQPRCTEIVCEEYIEIVTEEDLIEDYNVKLFFTEHHYLKKISLVSLRANPIQNLKENDRIIQEIETTNKSDLLLFSNQHVVYKVKVHELEDCKASSLGLYLANLLNLQENEQIMYIVATNDYQGHMLIAFENGKIAKIPLNSYETKTNRKKLVNAYCDKSICIGIFYLENDQDMIAVRDDERIILFNTDLVSVKSSRTTQGIQVLRITKKGYMKEIKMPQESYIEQIEEYRIKKIPMSGKYLQEKIELDQVDQ